MQIVRGKKLQLIFSDHWGHIREKYGHLLKRPAIMINVSKMLACGTEAMGFHHYRCPSCLAEKKVFHTCKSRFCSSCGIAQTKRWKEQFNALFAPTAYKHVIFHPPSEFRDYFKIGKSRYFQMLFETVNQTMRDWYTGKGYLPGIMAVIHTFGRDEKFTPHIHCLVTCGGLDRSRSRWITPVLNGFIPHDFLRMHFRTHFLTNMQTLWKNQVMEAVPHSCHFLFRPIFQSNLVKTVLGKVWFVWVGRSLENAFNAVTYVARYTKRPPIAEGNIVGYDGERVIFTFVDHKSQQRECLNLSAEQFITLLIRHIPDTNFRVVRYSGIFANRVRGRLLPQAFALLGQSFTKVQAKLTKKETWWRRQLELFTGTDPLTCWLCLVPLELMTVVYSTGRSSDTYG
ncbi:MAG: transposase [Acidobacteria bacterium]|nr:transposase [Acidobacteriota bacterium]